MNPLIKKNINNLQFAREKKLVHFQKMTSELSKI